MPPAYRRSRVIWDQTTRNDHETVSSWILAWIRAILYELQPVRFAEIDWKYFTRTFNGIAQAGLYCLKCLPTIIRVLAMFVRKQKFLVLSLVLYAYAVRWIHETLDAGPIVLILTTLVLIFTIGLSDNNNNDNNNEERLSAYSVFNRGFERLLGSVDAESLLAQHVGMGPGAVLPVVPQHEQRQQQQQQQRLARRNPQPNPELQQDLDNQQQNNNNNNNNNNRSRKSGKKARRRNLEQRREIQRQRDAAVALGLQQDGGGEGWDETQEEMMAMQRLIEEQIENNNNNN